MRIAKGGMASCHNTACYAQMMKTVLSVNDPDHIPLVHSTQNNSVFLIGVCDEASSCYGRNSRSAR